MIEKHYKTAEVAELLGLHPETIRKYARTGQIGSVRAGMDRIFPESEVRKFLDANRQQAKVVSLDGARQDRASTTRRRA